MKAMPRGSNFIDLSGQRFGHLLALSVGKRERREGRHYVYWNCVCDCGERLLVDGHRLRTGNTKSCGKRHHNYDARSNGVREAQITHGMSKTPEYKAWAQAKSRCVNTQHQSYKRYGARGISMHPEWAGSFSAFCRYIGPRPSSEHSLERIDNNKGYVPGNVKWATHKEQAQNRRNTKLTSSSVDEIRNSSLNAQVLAKQHNVTQGQINKIRRQTQW